MTRLPLVLSLCACFFLAWPARASADPVAATVISMEGTVSYDEEGALKPVELGQLLGEGDRVVTADDSTLHLVLPDGSSLVLAANSEVTLRNLGSGAPASHTLLSVLKGLVNLMVEKQGEGSSFEVETGNAVAAVKGTDFEVSADTDNTQVTVNEGEVHLGDPDRKRFEPIHPLESSRLFNGRLEHANALGKRDIDAFRARWQRAHMIHQQRGELLKAFRKQGRRQRQAFRARHARRQQWLQKHPLAASRARPGLEKKGEWKKKHRIIDQRRKKEDANGG
jgi:hypothetical protein